MKKHITTLSALAAVMLALSACAPEPLEPVQMVPAEAVYGQVDKNRYLSDKMIVGNVTFQTGAERMAPLYSNASTSLESMLLQAGYLAKDEKSARYRLDATIKDVAFPSCIFGYCETGASVEYMMTRIKDEDIVYRDMLVVPHTGEYPLMGANMALVQRHMLGAALGENYAHLLQVLSRLKKSDLK